MTFSAKVVAGGVLTFFMLGLSHLFQHGQFLAPFPFVSEFAFVIISLIVFNRLQSFGYKSIPFLLYAITGVLAGRFLWEIVLPLDDLVYLFEETSFIDLMLLIHFIALITCVIIVTSWIKSKLIKWIHLLFIPLLVWIIIINGSHLLFGWYTLYGVLCLVSLKDDETRENGLNESLELFAGLGLIYLLSIISILWQ